MFIRLFRLPPFNIVKKSVYPPTSSGPEGIYTGYLPCR